MIDCQDAKKVAEILAAVAEPTRVQILHQLARGPQYVGQLSEALGVPMVNMSHHLGVMRNAGILDSSKDGRKVVYSLRPEVFTPGEGRDTLGTLQIGPHKLTFSAPEKGRRRGEK